MYLVPIHLTYPLNDSEQNHYCDCLKFSALQTDNSNAILEHGNVIGPNTLIWVMCFPNAQKSVEDDQNITVANRLQIFDDLIIFNFLKPQCFNCQTTVFLKQMLLCLIIVRSDTTKQGFESEPRSFLML